MRFFLNSRRIYALLILLTTIATIYILYVKKDRRDFIKNYYSDETDYEKRRYRLLKNTRKLSRIRYLVKEYNIKKYIHNSNLGPITKKTFVIVIQCHANVNHLKRLLSNLKTVYFINRALLIFSHDFFSDKMNKLIVKIDFAQYMQIFYPYSIQLHSEVFPGAEPEDSSCEKSKTRDPEAAQSKHHWWWQANQIFDHLYDLEEYTEPILFLDANNYVMLDVLFVFKLLVNVKKSHCTYCEMISLAAHDPEVTQYKKRKCIVALEAWKESMPNTAIAFDRKTWHDIKAQKEFFCLFNDSKWDNSLKHASAASMQGSIYLVAIDGPRVFRIEECTAKDAGCDENAELKAIKHFTRLVSKNMFPQSLRIRVPAEEGFNATAAGDFSDVRDHELCIRFANESNWFES